jgi:uncharacterized protein
VLSLILPALDSGHLMVIDDFDTGLHPLVAGAVVRNAQRAIGRSGVGQLLLTSHNVALMTPEVLTNSAIWLVERDNDLASHLLPVSQRARGRDRIAPGYLRGRYGAIPRIQSTRTAAAGELNAPLAQYSEPQAEPA